MHGDRSKGPAQPGYHFRLAEHAPPETGSATAPFGQPRIRLLGWPRGAPTCSRLRSSAYSLSGMTWATLAPRFAALPIRYALPFTRIPSPFGSDSVSLSSMPSPAPR